MSLIAVTSAAAYAIDASDIDAVALARAAIRPAFAGSPLWYALPPSEAPDAGTPLGELVAWCAEAAGRDVAGLGAAIGLVHELYTAHGWAIAAAQAAAGERPLPGGLAATVPALARARFVIATAELVADADPDLAALEELEAPVGGDLARGVLAKLIEAAAGDDETAAGEARAEATLDEVAYLFETALPPAPAAAPVAPVEDLLVALHALGKDAWTWGSTAEWLDEDPLLLVKAIARAQGRSRFGVLVEGIRGELMTMLASLVALAWRGCVERVGRAARQVTAPRLDLAVIELAETAAAAAATRLATAAHAHWTGRAGEDLVALCRELLGDPRDVSALWERDAPAIRAALGAG